MQCVNLKERFGKRYRTRTEADQRTSDPWMLLIPCRNGEIGPYGGDVMQATSDLLLTKMNESHPTERADLFGKRMVACVETTDGKSLNESLIKSLSGGERVRARKCHKDFFEFDLLAKFVICTNHKPIVKGSDHGIWRRLALVPFGVKFWDPDKGESGPDELKIDKRLPEKLAHESEGVLRWAVEGCLQWQQGGLRQPQAVREATGQYRSDQDRIGQFIAECCITGGMVRVRANLIYARYRAWSEQRGEYPVSQQRFGESFTERGIERMTNNGTWYVGIALRNETTE